MFRRCRASARGFIGRLGLNVASMLVLVGWLYRRRVAAPEMTLVFTAARRRLVRRGELDRFGHFPSGGFGLFVSSTWCGCAAPHAQGRRLHVRCPRARPGQRPAGAQPARGGRSRRGAARRHVGAERRRGRPRPRASCGSPWTRPSPTWSPPRSGCGASGARAAEHRRGEDSLRETAEYASYTVEDSWRQWADANAVVQRADVLESERALSGGTAPFDLSGRATVGLAEVMMNALRPPPSTGRCPWSTGRRERLPPGALRIPGSSRSTVAAPRRTRACSTPRSSTRATAASPALEGAQQAVRRGRPLPHGGQDQGQARVAEKVIAVSDPGRHGRSTGWRGSSGVSSPGAASGSTSGRCDRQRRSSTSA